MHRVLCVLVLLHITAPIFAQTSSLDSIVLSMDGLSDQERTELSTALNQKFASVLQTTSLAQNGLSSVRAVVAAGLFDEITFNTIADVALKAYQAVENNAPTEYVDDLAVIGFSSPISAEQLEFAAKAIQLLTQNEIESTVIDEIVSYGIYNNWTGATLYAVCEGIVKGHQQGLESDKIALYLIIAIDQKAENESVETTIQNGLTSLSQTTSQSTIGQNDRDKAFQVMKESIARGVPNEIANEIFTTAVTDKWSEKLTKAVFDGLVVAENEGMSLEKLGTSILIRIAQGNAPSSPETMVSEELTYIRNLEKTKLKTIQKDQEKYKRTPQPIYQNQLGYTQPTQPEQQKKTSPPVTYFQSAQRNSLNEQLMWQVIREFLGPPTTPYRWGGTTRYGIDCSGFTQVAYKQLGIFIPRTSRQQFGTGMTLMPNQLKFGDLIFFSKYFNDYITHVGIFLGNGNFAHSSSSKGVNIASLNQRYYRLRYRGARRIVY
ncbi:C40 family peptidase [candidate division KSB1 bacterium]|nr:C40 family peptidase [candidate division KSB1 bacterium]